jgi:toxin ParE1/3/4
MNFGDLPKAPLADVHSIIDYYLREAGEEVALSFIDALERAMRHVENNPDSGSPRLGKVLRIPGLRIWPMKGFSHIILYRVTSDKVTFIRILHSARDVPRILRELD